MTVFSCLQSVKQESPILITEHGIVMLSIFVATKAPSPIFVKWELC